MLKLLNIFFIVIFLYGFNTKLTVTIESRKYDYNELLVVDNKLLDLTTTYMVKLSVKDLLLIQQELLNDNNGKYKYKDQIVNALMDMVEIKLDAYSIKSKYFDEYIESSNIELNYFLLEKINKIESKVDEVEVQKNILLKEIFKTELSLIYDEKFISGLKILNTNSNNYEEVLEDLIETYNDSRLTYPILDEYIRFENKMLDDFKNGKLKSISVYNSLNDHSKINLLNVSINEHKKVVKDISIYDEQKMKHNQFYTNLTYRMLVLNKSVDYSIYQKYEFYVKLIENAILSEKNYKKYLKQSDNLFEALNLIEKKTNGLSQLYEFEYLNDVRGLTFIIDINCAIKNNDFSYLREREAELYSIIGKNHAHVESNLHKLNDIKRVIKTNEFTNIKIFKLYLENLFYNQLLNMRYEFIKNLFNNEISDEFIFNIKSKAVDLKKSNTIEMNIIQFKIIDFYSSIRKMESLINDLKNNEITENNIYKIKSDLAYINSYYESLINLLNKTKNKNSNLNIKLKSSKIKINLIRKNINVNTDVNTISGYVKEIEQIHNILKMELINIFELDLNIAILEFIEFDYKYLTDNEHRNEIFYKKLKQVSELLKENNTKIDLYNYFRLSNKNMSFEGKINIYLYEYRRIKSELNKFYIIDSINNFNLDEDVFLSQLKNEVSRTSIEQNKYESNFFSIEEFEMIVWYFNINITLNEMNNLIYYFEYMDNYKN